MLLSCYVAAGEKKGHLHHSLYPSYNQDVSFVTGMNTGSYSQVDIVLVL